MNALRNDNAVITDSRTLRNAFGCFPSGVTAICAMVEREPVGMAASSFTSVSLDPPLVLVCVRNSSDTWRKLYNAPRIGVSVLGEEHDRACKQLASKSENRFADVEWSATGEGAVLIDGAVVSLECTVVSQTPAGDHQLVLLQIEALAFQPTVNPLVFHGSRFKKLASDASGTQ